MKVLAIINTNFEDLEAIGTIALLRRAGIQVDIGSFQGESCKGRYDITINTLNLYDLDSHDYDLLLVPGGPHYKQLQENQKALDLIEFYATRRYIAAICAAPTILGKNGLLKGKNYTCFSSMNEDFGGNYIDKHVVVDDNIITAKSAASTIDFAFAIIEKLLGIDKANEIKNQIYYFTK